MDLPIQISFRHMDPSPALDADLRHRCAALKRRAAGLTACRVVVEAPAPHHRKGGAFAVRLELELERGATFVCGGVAEGEGHEDAYVAARDTFDAAARLLADGKKGHGRPKGGRAGGDLLVHR